MNITSKQSKLRTIKSDDPRFLITDDMVLAPRAGFEFSDSCPKEYKAIMIECIQKGWLKPVATLHEKELIFMGLSK